jgi:hypothetical protein
LTTTRFRFLRTPRQYNAFEIPQHPLHADSDIIFIAGKRCFGGVNMRRIGVFK